MHAAIKPGRPAPTIGPGTATSVDRGIGPTPQTDGADDVVLRRDRVGACAGVREIKRGHEPAAGERRATQCRAAEQSVQRIEETSRASS